MALPDERKSRIEKLLERIIEILLETKSKERPTEKEEKVEFYNRNMEYYDFDESARMDCSTVAAPAYEFKEKPVKFLWLYASGAPIQVGLDKAVSLGDSFVIPAGAIVWVRRRVRRVYGQTLAGTGTLYIWGFW